MKQRDVLMLMDAVAPAIAGLFGKAMAPLVARLADVEKQLAEARADLAARPDVEAFALAAVAKALADQPKAEPIDFDAMVRGIEDRIGERLAALPKAATAEEVAALIPAPKDGKDADPVAIKAMVDEAVAAIPMPKDGEPGKDGVPGRDGKDGSDGAPGAAGRDGIDGKSITIEDVAPMIAEQIAAAFATMPIPKDGRDGEPGKDGRDGMDGKNGAGLAGVLKDHEGCVVFTLTDGAIVKLGKFDGRDGEPGKDGTPGRDVDPEFVRATIQEELQKQITAPLADAYKGVWKPGTYKRGDAVTWAGSLFIAKADTETKPETDEAWVLVVKRGRDGKDGEAPKPPPTVKLR